MRAMKVNTKKIEEERQRKGEGKCRFASNIGLSVYGYDRILREESTSMKTITRIASALHMNPLDIVLP